MKRIILVSALILLTFMAACNDSANENGDMNNSSTMENPTFTGTIQEINDQTALVSAVLVEGNPEGDVFVDLSVNPDETFRVGDQVKVEFDGTIRESNPAQINTIFVERIE